jgi:hypothetical protein
VSQLADLGTRHAKRVQRGVQLPMASPHSTPESRLTQADSSSDSAPPQQLRGEHAVHEHITDCVMLKPGNGGG